MLFDVYLEEANSTQSFKELIVDAIHKPINFLKAQWNEFKREFERYEPELCKMMSKKFNMNITSFKDIDDAEQTINSSQPITEDVMYSEGIQELWTTIKQEAQAALFFWPVMQLWLEFDKFVKGQEANKKVLFAYGTFWAALVIGKYLKGRYDKAKEARAEEERRAKLKKKIKPRIHRSIKNAK